MLDSGPRSLREAAAKILAWIVCANMLLKGQEIQSIFFIDPKTSTLEYTFRKLQKSCKGIVALSLIYNFSQLKELLRPRFI